jgi:hypothetical protein
MPCEHIGVTHPFIIEKPIRRLCMGPILTCPGDAFRAGAPKLLEHNLEASAQPFVFELRPIGFVLDPNRYSRMGLLGE